MCFCFNVLSSKLFLESLFPSETTLERNSVPLLSFSKPHGTSLWPIWRPPILIASLTECEGWGNESPALDGCLGQMSQLVSNKTTAGLLPPHAPVFASSLEQKGLFASNHPQRVFSYCLTDLRTRNAHCFPTSSAPCSPVFYLGLPWKKSREFMICCVWCEQQKWLWGRLLRGSSC